MKRGVRESVVNDEAAQEQDEPRVEIRYDAPHARSSHRPHARFGAPRPASGSQQRSDDAASTDSSPATASLTQEELELLLEEDAAEYLPPSGEEITFADAVEEPLASDLIPVESIVEDAPVQAEAAPAAADKKPAALW